MTYEGGVFSFTGRVLFLPVRIRKKEHASGAERKSVSFLRKLSSRPYGKIFLKNAYTTLKRLMPCVRIPRLKLHFMAAGEDPANTALAYGAVGAALELLRTKTSGYIRKPDLRAEIDFQRSEPQVAGCVLISLYFYQALWFGLCFGWGFWRDYRRQRRGV